MSCPSCGLAGYGGYCPVCTGDFDTAVAHGLIDPRDYEPERQPTPEDECESLSQHAPRFPLSQPGALAGPLGLSCWCGCVSRSLSPADTLPA